MRMLIQLGLLVLVLYLLVRLPDLVRAWRTPGPKREPRKPTAPQRKPSRQEQAVFQRYGKWVEEVASLSLAEAERRARSNIGPAGHWSEVGTPSQDLLAGLPSSVISILREFGGLKEAYGVALIGSERPKRTDGVERDVLTFGEKRDDNRTWWRIGTDHEGEPLMVNSNEETLYILRKASAPGGKPWTSTHPSIWHYVLLRSFRELD